MTTAKHPIPDERTDEHKIYTLAEARSLGLDFQQNWKDAQEGQWFKTTDGWVIECLRRARSASGEYIRTAVGTYALSGKICDTKPRQNRYTFSGKVHWSADVRKNRCGKSEQKFCDIIVRMLLSDDTLSLPQAGYLAFPKVWEGTSVRCEKKVWRRFCRNMLLRPHVKREIRRQMGSKTTEIDDVWMMEQAVEAYHEVSNSDGLARLRALNEIAKLRKNISSDISAIRPEDLSADEIERIEKQRQHDLRELKNEPLGGEDRRDDVVDNVDDDHVEDSSMLRRS